MIIAVATDTDQDQAYDQDRCYQNENPRQRFRIFLLCFVLFCFTHDIGFLSLLMMRLLNHNMYWFRRIALSCLFMEYGVVCEGMIITAVVPEICKVANHLSLLRLM